MTSALIGRGHPAGMLRAEIGRATDSHGGLVLVTGEAGIGKTTLVTAAADEARRLGALVLSGSCWDSDSAPGYWPWVQVIRGLRRAGTADELAVAQDAAGDRLAVLLGEAAGTDGTDGFQFYDAVTTALVAVSQRRPVLVVLDDLHWADSASLKLLDFAARHTWFERLLLVGTYRDVEMESVEHPLRPLLMPLVAKATTVTLTGLDRDEVGALMARTTGHEPEPDLVAEVHRRTGGNPFFVEQTARLWRSGGPVTGIAPGVRDALHRRLSMLPAPVVRLLTAGAVLGRQFHRQVLAATVAAPVAEVDRLLDQAVVARLVLARTAGQFAFAHDLVRETLHDTLDEAELRRWHGAVVRALDHAPALAERIFPADLARHAYLAGDEVAPAHAVELLLAAARDAGSRMAVEEVIGHHRRAFERAGSGDPHRRAVIALDLGQQLHHIGEHDEAWRIFYRAVELVREVDEAELLARAALTLHRIGARGERAQLTADLLAEAHRRLVRGGADDGGASDGAAGDGRAGDGGAAPDCLARELTIRLTVLARLGADDEALAFGLWAHHDAIWGLGSASERVAVTDELIAVARRTADHGAEEFASSLRWVALLEQGDPRYLDQYDAFLALAEREGLPRSTFSSCVDRSIIAAQQGRFEEADDLLDLALAAFGDHGHPHFGYMGDQIRWALWLLQGRFDDLDTLQTSLAEHKHPYPRLLAGIVALQRGDVDTARRHLRELTPGGESLPRYFAPLGLRFQAHVAAASRDSELCERSRAALAPYRGQWLMSLYGCDISGPVDLWLGLVDAAQGRWAEAIDELTAAYRSADRLKARPWSVEARAQLAHTLLIRAASGDAESPTADAETAGALLSEVEREAVELGMRHIVDRVPRLRSGPQPLAAVAVPRTRTDPTAGPPTAAVPANPDATSHGVAPTSATNEFRRDGAVWAIRFAGRTAHLPDVKGLSDLHLLLGRPGTDVAAVRLLHPEGGEVVVAAGQMGGDPVLDDEARLRYKRRLTQLDEEIDRAALRGDDRRAAEFDRERAALLTELRTAVGLGGRSRRLGDEAERARKTVTARIRDTLRKLDQLHPELAEHLRASVSTGSTCRYQPDGDPGWRLH